MFNLILFGPPGSGKGTQSEKLIVRYGLKHLSTGDLLRSEITRQTALGMEAKNFMDKGQLVPDEVVIGMPKQLNNQDSETAPAVRKFVELFKNTFPEKPISLADERFTSSMAHRTMIDGGMSKKNRQVKGNVDKISATIILQSFMESKR